MAKKTNHRGRPPIKTPVPKKKTPKKKKPPVKFNGKTKYA